MSKYKHPPVESIFERAKKLEERQALLLHFVKQHQAHLRGPKGLPEGHPVRISVEQMLSSFYNILEGVNDATPPHAR